MPLTGEMTLEGLLGELGIEGDALTEERKRIVLPPEKQRLVDEPVDGSPPLVLASRNGDVDCVRLLLRCGADLNALDGDEVSAIERSLEGQHDRVTSLLLNWDSAFPSEGHSHLREHLDGLIEEDEGLRKLFEDREEFHHLIGAGDFEKVEELLAKDQDSSPRCWVNKEGESALYTSSVKEKPQLWALLQYHRFVYANKKEFEDIRDVVDDGKFHRASAEYFVPLKGCHVQKMLDKSMVHSRTGEDTKACRDKVECWFKEMDKIDLVTDILQCLQCDPYLDIVFDFSSDDIQAMYPLNHKVKVYGLMEPRLKRIYTAAMETTKFTTSDIASNVIHEMTHRALQLVFENGGLPYGAEDPDAKEAYKEVVSNIVNSRYEGAYQKIIDRAVNSKEKIHYEMIVRVTEIMVKHFKEKGMWGNVEEVFDSEELMALYDFYVNDVQPVIQAFVEDYATANMVSKSEFAGNDVLATSFYSEDVKLIESAELTVRFGKYKSLEVIGASNLMLAVSHLRKSGRGYVFVDWSKYENGETKEFLKYCLDKRKIDVLAIIWDKKTAPNFCNRSRCVNNCIIKSLEDIADKVVVVVRMLSGLEKCRFLKDKWNIYDWEHLSTETKNWILYKRLNFVGTWTPLREVIRSLAGQSTEEDKMGELFEASEISMLIDQVDVRLGKALASALEDNEDGVMHCPDQCYINRRLKVKHADYERAKARGNDMIFVRHAEGPLGWGRHFEGSSRADGEARCFSVGERDGDWDLGKECTRVLKESEGERDFHFAHLFIQRYDEMAKEFRYSHCYSIHRSQVERKQEEDLRTWEVRGDDILEVTDYSHNEPVILADSPGSGKSVFIRRIALNANKDSKRGKRWVALVDLPVNEKNIKKWKLSDLEDPKKALDYVYDVVKEGKSSIEKKLFERFFQQEGGAVLLFDAFDEISSDPEGSQVKVKTLIRTLKGCTKAKIFVSSRGHECRNLEDCMGTMAFDFVAITRQQRSEFLNEYWRARLESSEEDERQEKLDAFLLSLGMNKVTGQEVDGLKDLISKVSGKKRVKKLPEFNLVKFALQLLETVMFKGKAHREFSSTPLHCFMLAYIVYELPDSVFKSMRRYELYRSFTFMKLEIYHRDKKRAPLSEAALAEEKVTNRERHKGLKKLSAYIFLGNEEYVLDRDEMRLVVKHGLVTVREETYLFVHRTFGEYFFAYWLSENASRKPVTKVMLEEVLMDHKYRDVRVFLDGMYSTRPLKPLRPSTQTS